MTCCSLAAQSSHGDGNVRTCFTTRGLGKLQPAFHEQLHGLGQAGLSSGNDRSLFANLAAVSLTFSPLSLWPEIS
jgi:hypothetical protein